MKADTLSKWLLIALLVLIIFWSFSPSVDGFQVNTDPNDPLMLAMNLIEIVDRTPPEWLTEAQITKSNSIKPRFQNYMQSILNPNDDSNIGMQKIIQILTPILAPVYTASKAAGDSESDTYDKLMNSFETFLANPSPSPTNVSSDPLPPPITVNTSLPSSMDTVMGLFMSVNSPSPPAWATPAQITKAGTITDNVINKNLPKGFYSIPNLGETYAASKAAGDTDSVTYDKITAEMETYLAYFNTPASAPSIQIGPVGSFGGPTGQTGIASRIPERINTFFRNLPNDTNTNEHKLLLMSVVSTPPPSWATAKQIADTNKQITNFMGTSVASGGNKARTIFNNALSKAYTESKAAGDTDSVTLDKLIAAMRAALTSGEVVTADVPEPTVVNPSWAANKNPISLSDLPNWVITGTHDPSWMSPTQIAQLSTLQMQADNIKNSPENLGLLFGYIRTTYIVSKSHMQPDSHCLEQIMANSNLAINGNSNYVVPATEPSSIKTWPSFTTATLASDLSEAISKVYATAGLPDIDKFYRINSLFYFKSIGHDPRGAGFGKHIPPPPKVSSSSLVPVGIQILCKLSDLAGYLKFVNGKGIPFLDAAMTPADYASRYPPSMIPPGLTAKIIDKSNGAIVWDPITAYVTNGTIAPFPNTTNIGTYVFYTNVGKIVPYEVPQKQSDRNAIDRILYNILDIFVTIDGTDKTSSLYGYLVNNMNISPELISASSFISSFQFQNIVYETYSTVSEDFTGSQNDSLQLNKLHYGDGTKLFPMLTVTSVLAYGSAIALFGGAVYYAMKKKIFKRFR